MRLTWIAVWIAFVVEIGAQGAPVQPSAQQQPSAPAAAALDNASGISVMLTLAEHFAAADDHHAAHRPILCGGWRDACAHD